MKKQTLRYREGTDGSQVTGAGGMANTVRGIRKCRLPVMKMVTET